MRKLYLAIRAIPKTIYFNFKYLKLKYIVLGIALIAR